MDRRDFLRTTGAAAVAAGAVAPAARSAEGEAAGSEPAPAAKTGRKLLTLAADDAGDLVGFGPERLARRIETATDGRCRFEITRNTIAKGAADADLTYGNAVRHAGQHPAFHFFAGLPMAQGLDASSQQTWLAVGGGEMLWDDLAAAFGFKPLLVGHTGVSTGIWAGARLEQASDLAGATLHVAGLAADVVRALGATPVEMAPHELKGALAAGRIGAAEWLGPLAATSPDLQPLAQRVYEPGLHQHGMMLSLAVSRRIWDGMSAADRAIFEACAAQEYHLSLADARAHALIAAQVEAPAKWPVRLALSAGLADALDLALAEVVESIATADPDAGRIHDSYQAFRGLLGEDVIA